MRIGLIAPPWLPVPPPAYGGTEAVIDRLARGLTALGEQVRLWTTGDSTCPVERCHVLPVSMPERMGVAVIEAHHVITAYEELAPWADVVHDHTVVGPLAALLHPELPVVTTAHGPFASELSSLYRSIADRVAVVAISHHQARTAGGIRIAAVIHHGLDLDEFPVGDGSGDEHGDYLLFLGRMAPEKGPRRAVLAARAAGLRLIIAAKMQEPAERAYFAEQIEPLLDDQVTYVGEVGSTDRVRLLGGARALLNPIAWPEPFGLVMIEALACGTPVVALGHGSAPELVEHGVTGFIAPSDEDLPTFLRRVGEIDRGACRAAAEARFSTGRMVRDHRLLYRRLTRPTTVTS